MTSPFLKINHPHLKKVSKAVPISKIFSKEIKGTVQLMLKIAGGERKDKKRPIMVGLAAPQIGILKRIILVDTGATCKGLPATPRKPGLRDGRGKLKVYINPKIIWKSKTKEEWAEGCYSTGRVCGIVSRSISIKIRCLKLHSWSVDSNPDQEWKFKEVEEKYTGFVARIFQHEIDHLNGKVFINLIKDPDKLHYVPKKDFPKYRKNQAWKNWPRKYPLPLAYRSLKRV